MPDQSTSPPPAYFLSLSLENVRSFGAKQAISFATKEGRPAQWTIILGDNGVGKTTVLKSLAALQPIQFDTEDNIYWPDFDSSWRGKWWPIRHEGEKNLQLKFHAQTGEKLISSTNYITDEYLDVKVPGKVKSTFLASGTDGNVGGLICYGYGAGRTTGNSTLTDSPETADTCASLFNDRADLLNPEEWFLNIDYGIRLLAEDKRKQLSDANDRVRQMLKDVLPGVTDLRIENSGTPQKPQISLQFLLYGTWVRLRDMSLGYQTLIVWLTDLASKLFVRYPESDNPLAEPAIVLIDEIDLHLHPQWQRELLGMLSKIFVNTQFIATAHSPLVVQAATDADANVVLLKREGDQTVVVTDVEDVRGWRLDQILTSELFGLETARSPETEKLLKRRAELLSQATLSAAEKQELAGLTDQLGLQDQPVGETPSEKQVHAVLRQLRQKLGKQADA